MIFRRSKYGNKKTRCLKDHKHDSMAEARYCDAAHANLTVVKVVQQPKVYLTAAKILYKPDFLISFADGSESFVDVKGMLTPVFAIKMRLWAFYGPIGSKLMLVSGNKIKLVFGPAHK